SQPDMSPLSKVKRALRRGTSRCRAPSRRIGLLLIFALLEPSLAFAQPADLDTFGQTTRERLAREPMEAQIEPVPDYLPYKKFKLTLRSLDGVRVRGWLALPIQGEAPAKLWPVIVSTPGYGGWQQGVMLSECQRGY